MECGKWVGGRSAQSGPISRRGGTRGPPEKGGGFGPKWALFGQKLTDELIICTTKFREIARKSRQGSASMIEIGFARPTFFFRIFPQKISIFLDFFDFNRVLMIPVVFFVKFRKIANFVPGYLRAP